MGGIAGEAPPAVVAGEEQEAEIMDVAIVLAGFDGERVLDRLLGPEGAFRGFGLGTLGEHPHHAGQKAIAPVGPGGAIGDPAAIIGGERIESGMFFDQLADLSLRMRERLFEQVTGVARKMNHMYEDDMIWRAAGRYSEEYGA
mgnify:CR=1 FL=1